MRRFIAECLLFALLQAAFVTSFLWTFYDARDENPLYAATLIKHRRFDIAPSPRVILVGGSNLLFGIDSAMIEQQTPYHPVNMGLMGGLRLGYMLNETGMNVRAGDLVVLSLEYASLNAGPDDIVFEVVLGMAMWRPANLAYLTLPQWKRLLDSEALQQAGLVFRQACGNLGQRFTPAKKNQPAPTRRERRRQRERDNEAVPDGGRVLENINHYGDLTRYHAPDARLPRRSNDQQVLARINPDQVRANLERINDFARRCEARGVRVVYAAPPVPHSEFERHRDVAAQVETAFADHLRISVLRQPSESVFADRDFIGLSYHLHGEAVRQRTQRLIDAIIALPPTSRPESSR